MAAFAIYVCSEAQKVATNRLFAMIAREDPMTSENLSVPLSANGSLPASHWCGGRPVGTAWLDVYQNLSTSLPAPSGGWPLLADGVSILTESAATAAAAALYLNVNTGPDAEALPTQNMSTVLAALTLKRVVFDL